jgi:hypothetical protein
LKEWLVFSFTLPKEPSRARVSVWRKLKRAGAINKGQSMWLLPLTDDHIETFRSIAEEVLGNKGEAYVMQASFLDIEYDGDINFNNVTDKQNDNDEPQLEKEMIMLNDGMNAGKQKELKLRRYFNGNADQVFDKVAESVQALKNDNNVANIFNELPGAVPVSEDVELKVVYKDGKDGKKLEYQIRWPAKTGRRAL